MHAREGGRVHVEVLEREAEQLTKRIDDAITIVVNAETEADRAVAKAKLAQLQADQGELLAEIREAKAAAETLRTTTSPQLAR